jgi:putative transposase
MPRRGDENGVRTLFKRADRGQAVGMGRPRHADEAGGLGSASRGQALAFVRWLHQPERDPRRLTPWPMARLLRWAEQVSKPLTAAERHAVRNAVRTSVNRGTPLGDETWVQRIARQLNLQSTLRPRGRPKNES